MTVINGGMSLITDVFDKDGQQQLILSANGDRETHLHGAECSLKLFGFLKKNRRLKHEIM